MITKSGPSEPFILSLHHNNFAKVRTTLANFPRNHQLELVPVFLLLLKFGEPFQNEFTAGLYRPQNPPVGKSITDQPIIFSDTHHFTRSRLGAEAKSPLLSRPLASNHQPSSVPSSHSFYEASDVQARCRFCGFWQRKMGDLI
jgi:hypothetical protein